MALIVVAVALGVVLWGFTVSEHAVGSIGCQLTGWVCARADVSSLPRGDWLYDEGARQRPQVWR